MNVELVHEYLKLLRECNTLDVIDPEWARIFDRGCSVWAKLSDTEREHINYMELLDKLKE